MQVGQSRQRDGRGLTMSKARASVRRVGIGIAAISLALPAGTALPAHAQQSQGCEDHAQIRERLKTKFREDLSAIATNQYGWLIELYTSADGKSWTLVGTRPNGPACVFGTGQDWQMIGPIAGSPL
jgi:hypothetical protein